MSQKTAAIVIVDRKFWLRQYNITQQDFKKTGLKWDWLESIASKHLQNMAKLEPIAKYVVDSLRGLEVIHSTRYRIKDPHHLIEKIIRKKRDDPKLKIDSHNYPDKITDLVGVRLLHLFKEDWREIHDQIMSIWTLRRKPVANIREGDAPIIIQEFREAGFTIKKHSQGYRSIHYLIKCQPFKIPVTVEIQVRTIFEEGYSEIDHQLRYPYRMDNYILDQFLRLLNRLAGSADEMGSFVRTLQSDLAQKETEITDLKSKVKSLEINQSEKDDLIERIDAFSPLKVLWNFEDQLNLKASKALYEHMAALRSKFGSLETVNLGQDKTFHHIIGEAVKPLAKGKNQGQLQTKKPPKKS